MQRGIENQRDFDLAWENKLTVRVVALLLATGIKINHAVTHSPAENVQRNIFEFISTTYLETNLSRAP